MSNILLGVTGGIAAYKTAYLARLFISHGHKVRVMMTKTAEKFVGSLTFEAITGEEVFRPDSWPSHISHIEWAKWADICVIAPATANIIAKFRAGIADDPLSTTVLALKCPLLIAPAMNTQMFLHPTVTENIDVLANRGAYIINSEIGTLACGDTGAGRMAEPENIFAAAMSALLCSDSKMMKGKKVLVTAGATKEFIDPVRYITNMSSGKMGIAIAEAARAAGADVTLITGDIKITTFLHDIIKTVSASDMQKAVEERQDSADIIIMAAAVADYRPTKYCDNKIKKYGEKLSLELEKTADILQNAGKNKKNGQIIVGFAAETENIDENACQKLKNKNLDMIIANDVSRKDVGFDGDDNEVKIFFKDGSNIHIKKASKKAVAAEILYRINSIK